MKKLFLMLLCLIGLSAFNQVSAQNDLDIDNQTDCSFTVIGANFDFTRCISNGGTSITTSVPAMFSGIIFYPVILPTNPYRLGKFEIFDCDNNLVSLSSLCGGGGVLTGTFPWSNCCPQTVTATLTPSTPGSNAKITFN